MNKLILVALITCLKGTLQDSCEIHRRCRDCIQDASVCVWCWSTSSSYDNKRCKPISVIANNSSWCSDGLENPESSSQNSLDTSSSANTTQIEPQNLKLSLRPGQPHKFTFSFKEAQDYPVDLYFLFDASNTMHLARTETSTQAQKIDETMKKMTQYVYMGVGTFVDKNTPPFTQFVRKKKAYSFRHELNLTPDYTEFKKAIDAIKTGENRDVPEAGLDAIAQVLACPDVIGWRNVSRKILIFMTDSISHAAYDGRSAGIFKPYDEGCYTVNNTYQNELLMDYPSVSMISKMARENHVAVIFIVAESVKDQYSKLSEGITGSKVVPLKIQRNKDMDIVKKLKDIYEEITRRIKLNVNAQIDPSFVRQNNFDITFDPDCTKNLTACNILKNDVVNITGTITLLKYDGHDKSKIDITVEGVAEKLTLDINVIKDCGCEKNSEKNSESCNNGTQECGICQCNDSWYGDTCQCNKGSSTTKNSTSTCRTGSMTDDCNGKGQCKCGTCECIENFAGPYCECYLKNCPMSLNVMNVPETCGGPSRGKCQCDETCTCKPGWSGNACQCNQNLCQIRGKTCNGLGDCECGICKCNVGAWDTRTPDKHCVMEPCSDCLEYQCQIITVCALCLLKKTEDSNCSNCSYIQSYEILDKLSILNETKDTEWNICKGVKVDTGCYTEFAYKYDENVYGMQLMLQKDRNCAEIQYIFGATILLCILLVGIFTLLGWKLFSYLRDRKEYLEFKKMYAADSAPCENPLFEPATQSFNNPSYGKLSFRQ